jgi:hypothetical protein
MPALAPTTETITQLSNEIKELEAEFAGLRSFVDSVQPPKKRRSRTLKANPVAAAATRRQEKPKREIVCLDDAATQETISTPYRHISRLKLFLQFAKMAGLETSTLYRDDKAHLEGLQNLVLQRRFAVSLR